MAYKSRLDLDSLGWKAFQDLCGTVLRVVLGQTVHGFAASRDGGRDFAYYGTWSRDGAEAINGPFVVQCKFTTARSTLTESDLSPELPKVAVLAARGNCAAYVVMTNAGISGETERKMRELLAAKGIGHSLFLGREQIESYVLESARLRSIVPRLYGLGDLCEILDGRAYEQAQAILDWLRLDMITFVATQPYSRAERCLDQNGLALLVGPPGAGKSTIGAVLAIASGDEGCRPLKIDRASQFIEHWNPNDPKQFFWIDDPFGSTQMDPARVDEWNHVLPEMQAATANGARLVVVSRNYIWHDAQALLRTSRIPLLSESVVTVEASALSISEKRQIVYNHLKYGTQSAPFRAAVKAYLPAAAAVNHFLPEVARRFGNPIFTRGLEVDRRSVVGFFSHPVDHLIEVIGALPNRDKSALAIVYMAGGHLPSPVQLDQNQRDALQVLGGTPATLVQSLQALNGSLLVGPSPTPMTAPGASVNAWSFKHPTISEAVRRFALSSPEYLLVYVCGAQPYELRAHLRCDSPAPTGAIDVPALLWPALALRLGAELAAGNRYSILDFLTTNVGPAFLRVFVDANPWASSPEPNDRLSQAIAVLLSTNGLLPDPTRAWFVEREIASVDASLRTGTLVDGPSEALYTPAERERLKAKILDEVIPGLCGAAEALENDLLAGYESEPDATVNRLESALDTVEAFVGGDAEVDVEIESARIVLEEMRDALPPDPDDVDDNWEGYTQGEYYLEDGLFSDVDA